MRFIFNNTALAVGCGCRPRSKIPFCFTHRHAKAWAISERCVYATASYLPKERRSFSTPRHFGNFSSCSIKQAPAPHEELSSLVTTPNIIMRFYTNNGVSSTSPNSCSISCLRIALNLIRSKESGNSHAASAYTTYSSRTSKKSPMGWSNNLTNGENRMKPSENFAR